MGVRVKNARDAYPDTYLIPIKVFEGFGKLFPKSFPSVLLKIIHLSTMNGEKS